MTVKVISKSEVLIYQTYMDDDIELHGEPALFVKEYTGSSAISIVQEDNEVIINYESLPVLIKAFNAILKDKSFHEVKF